MSGSSSGTSDGSSIELGGAGGGGGGGGDGSTGTAATTAAAGGHGGGAIRLHAADTLTIGTNGKVLADGAAGNVGGNGRSCGYNDNLCIAWPVSGGGGGAGAGGGAGGAILLKARIFDLRTDFFGWSWKVSAKGGAGGRGGDGGACDRGAGGGGGGAGGAGGRVKFYYWDNAPIALATPPGAYAGGGSAGSVGTSRGTCASWACSASSGGSSGGGGTLHIQTYAVQPTTPGNAWPPSGAYSNSATLAGTEYSHPDGTGVLRTEFQVRSSGGNYVTPLRSGISTGANPWQVTPALPTDATYYWHVRYVDKWGISSNWSAETSVIIDTVAPTSPTTLLASWGPSSIALSWSAGSDAFSGIGATPYEVQYNRNGATDANGTVWVSGIITGTTSVTWAPPSPGLYKFRLKTKDRAANILVTTETPVIDWEPPSKPANVRADNPCVSQGATLRWDASSDTNGSTAAYEVLFNPAIPGSPFIVSGSATSLSLAQSELPPGSYLVNVRATDTTGNVSPLSDATPNSTILVDRTQPAQPADLVTSVSLSRVGFLLDWSPSSDASSPEHQLTYRLERRLLEDTLWVDLGPEPTPERWDAPMATAGYEYRAVAVDCAGNPSSPSDSVIAYIDNLPPSFPSTIDPGETYTNGSSTLTWSASDNGNAGYANADLQYSLDSGAWQFFPGGSNAVVSPFVSELPFDGTYRFRIRVRDSLGNESFDWSDPMGLLIVDRQKPTPPTIFASSPTNGWLWIQWNYSIDDRPEGVPIYRIEYTSPVHSTWQTLESVFGNDWYWGAAQDGDGTYVFRVRAIDYAGNVSDPPTAEGERTVVIDSQRPSAPAALTASINPQTQQITASWAPSLDPAPGTAILYGLEPCGTPEWYWPWSGTTTTTSAVVVESQTGTYSYQAVALDAAGNKSLPSSCTQSFQIDRSAPELPSSLTVETPGGVDYPYTSGLVTLSWSTTDIGHAGVANADMQLSADAGITWTDFPVPAMGITSPFVTEIADQGAYQFRIRVRDTLGNASDWSGPMGWLTVDREPPARPENVYSYSPTREWLFLSWLASYDLGPAGLKEYVVEYTSPVNTEWTQLGTTPAYYWDDWKYFDSLAIDGDGTYVLRVRARDIAGNLSLLPIPVDEKIILVDSQAPTKPQNVTATYVPGTRAITLNWLPSTDPSPGSGVATYMIERFDGTPSGAPDRSTSATSIVLGDLTSGFYSFGVRAVDSAGNPSPVSAPTEAVEIIDVDVASEGNILPTDFYWPPSFEGPTTVGTLPGSLDVDALGSANYRMPLWIPPGRAGVQPNLAIAYNSNARDGFLGIGWSLQATSEIYRCVHTLATEGQVKAISYDLTDSICLDGQKLIGIDGYFGNKFSEYRTEVETHSKIEVIEREGDEPLVFRVHRRDGTIATYGGVGARVEAPRYGRASTGTEVEPGGVVHDHWFLRELQDRSGNYIRFEYAGLAPEAGPTGFASVEPRLTRIGYTGWRGATTLEGRNEILFTYEERTVSTRRFSWIAGVRYDLNRRLASIAVRGPAPDSVHLLREYRLQYEEGDPLQLHAIKACDIQGICQNPTNLEWTVSQSAFERIPSNTPLANLIELPRYVDINGDSNIDVMYMDTIVEPGTNDSLRGYSFRLGSAAGFGPKKESGITRCKDCWWQNFQFGDLDGDGVVEFIQLNNIWGWVTIDSCPMEIWKFSGSSYAKFVGNEWPQIDECSLGSMFWTHDTSGDGVAEIFRQASPQDSEIAVWGIQEGRRGSPPFPRYHSSIDTGPAVYIAPFPLDIDGDGVSEFVVPDPASPFSTTNLMRRQALSITSTIDVANPLATRPIGSLVVKSTNIEKRYNDVLMPIDVNGDGLQDLLRYGPESMRVVYMNTGNGFDKDETVLPPRSIGMQYPEAYVPMDVNDDGAVDLIRDTPGGFIVTINHGGRFSSDSSSVAGVDFSSLLPSTAATLPTRSYVDLEGDGIADIVQIERAAAEAPAYLVTYKRPAAQRRFIKKVTNGHGLSINLEYAPITSSRIFAGDDTQGQGGCGYPQRCTVPGHWVVKSSMTNTPGVIDRITYDFFSPRRNVLGRGFLGFERVTRTREAPAGFMPRLFEEQRYDLHTQMGTFYPYRGVPVETTTSATLEDVPWSDSQIPLYYPSLDQTTTQVYLADIDYYGQKAALRVTPSSVATRIRERRNGIWSDSFYHDYETNYKASKRLTSFDRFGNLKGTFTRQIDYDTGEFIPDTPYQTLAIDRYDIRVSDWLLDLPNVVIKIDSSNGRTETRKTVYNYDERGRVKYSSQNPNELNELTSKFNEYSPQGLPTWITQEAQAGVPTSGGALVARDQRIEYDDKDFAFPVVIQNALGESRRFTYHHGLGVPLTVQDQNGVMVSLQYDGFGRPRGRDSPDGADAVFHYLRDPVDLNVTQVSARTTSGANSRTDYDLAGRPIRREAHERQGPGTGASYFYDDRGFLNATHETPFEAGQGTQLATTLTRDNLGRITEVLLPDGGHERWSFSLFRQDHVDGSDNHRFVGLDERGQVLRSGVVNEAGPPTEEGVTSYAYGPFGVIDQLRLPSTDAPNTIDYEYDSQGRLTHTAESRPGGVSSVRSTAYNGFGEIVGETAQDGRVRTYTVDLLGRTTHALSADGDEVLVWDTAVNGIGKLGSATSPDGITQSYTYDGLGRTSTITQTSPVSTSVITTSYDAVGRLDTLFYPEMSGEPRFGVRYSYDVQDQKSATQVGAAPAATPFWTADARNAYGLAKRETFGNGLKRAKQYEKSGRLGATVVGLFPELTKANDPNRVQDEGYDYYRNGSLRYREDYILDSIENFVYDHFGRLEEWQVGQGALGYSATRYEYDELGNLRHRRKLAGQGENVDYEYLSLNAGPHALSRMTRLDDLGGSPVEVVDYEYDDSGRQELSAIGSTPRRVLDYTTWDLPKTIDAQGGRWDYKYAPNHVRASKTGPDGTTEYFGEYYERTTGTNGEVLHVFNVFADGAPMAQVRLSVPPGGGVAAKETWYLHADHLGTVDTITNQAGALVSRQRFEPFGARRDPSALAMPRPAGLSVPFRSRGFAGLEHDPEGGLVNMRGRMYDPQAGRFLSRDPLVVDPLDGQDFNRYSYVSNNPLSMIDPSGYAEEMPTDSTFETGTDAGGGTWSVATDYYADGGGSFPEPSGSSGMAAAGLPSAMPVGQGTSITLDSSGGSSVIVEANGGPTQADAIGPVKTLLVVNSFAWNEGAEITVETISAYKAAIVVQMNKKKMGLLPFKAEDAVIVFGGTRRAIELELAQLKNPAQFDQVGFLSHGGTGFIPGQEIGLYFGRSSIAMPSQMFTPPELAIQLMMLRGEWTPGGNPHQRVAAIGCYTANGNKGESFAQKLSSMSGSTVTGVRGTFVLNWQDEESPLVFIGKTVKFSP